MQEHRAQARKLEREAGELRFVADSDDIGAFRSLRAWKSAQYRRTGQFDIFAWSWDCGGDTLAHWFPAYDVEFGRYSAGLIMHLRMAEFTSATGVRVITWAPVSSAIRMS